jgi:hypothetical protein
VFEMRETIQGEQEQARLAEEAKERYKGWLRRERQKDLRAKSAYLIGTAIFLLYLWLWFLLLSHLERK